MITELRIGNYLKDREGRLCKVTSLIYDRFVVDGVKALTIQGPLTALPNSPIEITEDMLLKCGFEKKQIDSKDKCPSLIYYELNNFKVFIMASKKDVMKDCFMPGYFIHAFDTIELLFLHQLQNLFFALTGEELIYTP